MEALESCALVKVKNGTPPTTVEELAKQSRLINAGGTRPMIGDGPLLVCSLGEDLKILQGEGPDVDPVVVPSPLRRTDKLVLKNVCMIALLSAFRGWSF